MEHTVHTETVWSIMQPDISAHFAHLRFQYKNFKGGVSIRGVFVSYLFCKRARYNSTNIELNIS